MSRILAFVLAFLIMAAGTGCSSSGEATGRYIIDAKDVSALMARGNAVIVDMQSAENYASGHVKGAVNITLNDIVINEPVSNMLAPKEQIEEVLGKNGISNDTTVVVYDDTNNMNAARFWWTLEIYGDDNVRVVSGGIGALNAAKAEMTSDKPSVTPAVFTAKDLNGSMLATKDDVLAQVNDPGRNVVLVDTRTQQEYDQGTIPGSVLLDYIDNDYNDGTYKSIQDIKIRYIENKITPDKTVILYCKTSVRAAQTYLALYNAGYRNLKLYDGAWLEWSSDKNLPVQMPNTGAKVQPNQNDNS